MNQGFGFVAQFRHSGCAVDEVIGVVAIVIVEEIFRSSTYVEPLIAKPEMDEEDNT
jgi:hypothetical protein